MHSVLVPQKQSFYQLVLFGIGGGDGEGGPFPSLTFVPLIWPNNGRYLQPAKWCLAAMVPVFPTPARRRSVETDRRRKRAGSAARHGASASVLPQLSMGQPQPQTLGALQIFALRKATLPLAWPLNQRPNVSRELSGGWCWCWSISNAPFCLLERALSEVRASRREGTRVGRVIIQVSAVVYNKPLPPLITANESSDNDTPCSLLVNNTISSSGRSLGSL